MQNPAKRTNKISAGQTQDDHPRSRGRITRDPCFATTPVWIGRVDLPTHSTGPTRRCQGIAVGARPYTRAGTQEAHENGKDYGIQTLEWRRLTVATLCENRMMAKIYGAMSNRREKTGTTSNKVNTGRVLARPKDSAMLVCDA